MAEQQLAEILHAFLSCHVCKGILREPVSLGCNHSFCQTCLSEFCEKQGDKSCLLCRRRISKEYNINFSLKELADCFALQLEDKKTGTTNQPEHYQSQMLTKRSTKDESTRSGAVDEEDLVDWNKPLLFQVGHLMEKYDQWVHKPVNRPIRLFESEFLEAGTKASRNVLKIWLLVVIGLLIYNCRTVLSKETDSSAHLKSALAGSFLWIFLIQFVHYLFHLRPPTHSYYLITIHFVLHGQHHKNPFDDSRHVFPLALSTLMMSIFFLVLRPLLPGLPEGSLLFGIICGYVISEMVHYYLHHGSPSKGSWFYFFKKSHLKHHYEHPDEGLRNETTCLNRSLNTGIPKSTQSKLQ